MSFYIRVMNKTRVKKISLENAKDIRRHVSHNCNITVMCCFRIEFVEMISDLPSAIREMGVWIINDARIPGLSPPAGMTLMDITRVSGEHFTKAPMTDAHQEITHIFTSGTTGKNLGLHF